ncbi:MAG TPA: diaminopimelate epimerase [Candidatus Limnocylindria bacterium]|nr:diaminopimelate epimerase [Candidatus Limnocylindria bacterium]
MRFFKYHALGNDYIVLDPKDFPEQLSVERIKLICHRNFGVGSDGILHGPLPSERTPFRLRIFNPDGSEAEKSGNGLRIFCRYLFDQNLVAESNEFLVDTLGGVVRATVFEGGRSVRVDMGRVSFWSDEIPMTGARREVLQEPLALSNRTFTICAATIGNPHCVIPLPTISDELARTYGPQIETHPSFPKRTNVQFLEILDRRNIRLEIWERGAGYTLASGSSSSAAAAVARKLGAIEPKLTVHMPGGALEIEIGEDFSIRMTGPVTKVATGEIAHEMLGNRI